MDNITKSSNDDSQPTGDCFLAAFNTLFDMMRDPKSSEFLLVHGNVARLPQDDYVNHAWVENATTVFDNSNGFHSQMLKDTYYSELKITATRQYTPMEAVIMKTRVGHHGPWLPGAV